MSEWVTDRLPTAEDADEFGDVWVTRGNGFVSEWNWRSIKPQMPWQPTNKPAPYVKLKRWHCRFDTSKYRWEFKDHRLQGYFLLPPDCTGDLAHRICKIFNEELP
jgi:hypothetical protein